MTTKKKQSTAWTKTQITEIVRQVIDLVGSSREFLAPSVIHALADSAILSIVLAQISPLSLEEIRQLSCAVHRELDAWLIPL